MNLLGAEGEELADGEYSHRAAMWNKVLLLKRKKKNTPLVLSSVWV